MSRHGANRTPLESWYHNGNPFDGSTSWETSGTGVEAELAATGRTASRPPSSAISTASRRTRPSPARRRLWTRAGVVVTNIEMSPLIYAPTKPGAKAHLVSDLLGESLSEAAYAA